MAYDNFLVDKRVVERNIAKGLIDAEELKRQIESLPDRESNCVHVSLDGNVATDEPLADDGQDAEDELDELDAEDEQDEPESSEPGPQG